MFDFEVQRCSRRCAGSDRELRPGEPIYSVLVERGRQIERLDFAEEAWSGPPEETVAFWRTRIPDSHSKRANWAPNDVMLDYFRRIEHDEACRDTRYVLSLLLMQRRVLQQERSEADAAGREVLLLHCPRDESEHRVAVVFPSAERIQQIQAELASLFIDGEDAGGDS